jgi:hypothetical protein
MKFRKKPVVVDATQWFKNGDHPLDNCTMLTTDGGKTHFLSEGKVVRYYRVPTIQLASDQEKNPVRGLTKFAFAIDDVGYFDEDVDSRPCEKCKVRMHDHGWIDTLEGGHIVCPGDWIITGVAGEHYPCKPDIFEKTYEAVEP